MRFAIAIAIAALVVSFEIPASEAKVVRLRDFARSTNFHFLGKFCFDIKGGVVKVAASLPKFYAAVNHTDLYVDPLTNKTETRYSTTYRMVNSTLYAASELLFYTDLDESWYALGCIVLANIFCNHYLIFSALLLPPLCQLQGSDFRRCASDVQSSLGARSVSVKDRCVRKP